MNKYGNNQPRGSLDHAPRTLGLGLMVLAAGLTTGSLEISSVGQETKPDHSRIIQYRGPMPLLPREHWGREVKLKFELYRSPEGGAPFWKETRSVPVRKDGWVSVDLGQVKPLPDEAFATSFRFLSIWHENVEFTPRKQVASLAYVALALKDQLLAKPTGEYGKAAFPNLPNRDTQLVGETQRLNKLVACGSIRMEVFPRQPTNWLSAVECARQLGARLPTFEEWYGAYDSAAGRQLADMEGHYEWVIPWVYEPTIHGRLHELYRGKPVACYYEELSPMNNYPFRLVAEGTPQSE